MKRIYLFLILFIMVSGSLFSAGSKEIEPLFSGEPDSRNRILILVELSEYRFALAQSIENNLVSKGDIYITLDDLASYPEYIVDDFTALVILNAGKMMNVDGKVKKIIGLSKKKYYRHHNFWE